MEWYSLLEQPTGNSGYCCAISDSKSTDTECNGRILVDRPANEVAGAAVWQAADALTRCFRVKIFSRSLDSFQSERKLAHYTCFCGRFYLIRKLLFIYKDRSATIYATILSLFVGSWPGRHSVQ